MRDASDTVPDSGSFEGDYLRINQLLAEIDQQVRESFLSGAALQADQQASPVIDPIQCPEHSPRPRRRLGERQRPLAAMPDTFASSVGLITGTLLTTVAPL